MQSDQLTTRIPNYSPNNIERGQQNDNYYPDNREEYLYWVDGTTDIHTPTDHSTDDEDTEPDNNTCKRQRKVYAPVDANRKELTKQRQAQVLKNQQEKERLKVQALEDGDNIDKESRTKTKRPTAQPEDNGDNIDDTNSPRPQRSKGKASHPDQIKSLKKNRKMPRASENATVPNDPPPDPDTPDEDPLIDDLIDTEDDRDYPLGPDELGFYTFFLKGKGNLPDLLGIEDDQLLAIQNDLHERMKTRDEARERAISKMLHNLEQKHEFINTQYLKHFAQVSELLEPTAKDAPARVKPADKMLMLPPLFDGEKPEKAKTHYEMFNQYIKFQTKEGNIKDPIKEAIELFELTLDKKALIWFQQHKADFKDLTTMKKMFLDQLQLWNNLSFDPQKIDIDEQIDLVLTLGNMLKSDKQAKMDTFIETTPTIIQTHLIIAPNWEEVTKKAKNLEHIIQRREPLAIAPPISQGTGAVPGLYSHIPQSQDQDSASLSKPFKSARGHGGKKSKGKAKPQQQPPPPPPPPEQEEQYEDANNYYHNENYRDNNRGHRPYRGQYTVESHIEGLNKREGDNKIIIEANTKATMDNLIPAVVALINNYYGNYQGRGGCGHGGSYYRPCGCGRGNYGGHNNYQYHQYNINDDGFQLKQYGPPCTLCGDFNHSPKHCFKGEHDINNLMEKMSLSSSNQHQNGLYQ